VSALTCTRRAALFLLINAGFVGAGLADDAKPPPEPADYRLDDYRAPTPATLSGARVVTTAEAHRLWTAKEAVFIDVLPQAPRPANLPETVLWRDKPRFDIPGSIWLPDTGYGALAPEVERYLFDGLVRASGGDKGKPILIYCQRNCWMSWNAAKRAMHAGYTNVIWFPEGTEGWSEEHYPLEERRPEPRG
jgi:PQQ-dependent catabolism-associated CXXCW motif protein